MVDLAAERIVLLSIHIVGDIGQTCRKMAVLDKGRIKYHGRPNQLIEAAKSHVWIIDSPNEDKPNHNLSVVSSMHLTEGMQYRVVVESAAGYPNAQHVAPGLEDSCVWLMKREENSN